MTYVSDELLLAYLDGQLEKSQALGVGQLSATNAEIARRLLRLKRTQGVFSETLSALAATPLAPPRDENPTALQNRAGAAPMLRSDTRKPQQARPARNLGQMLFVAAVFAGGIAGGYGATFLSAPSVSGPAKIVDRQGDPTPAPPSWTADIVRFHAFFPRETLTPHADAISNPELIGFHLSKVTGRPIVPPDFSRQGYTLFRGQAFNYQQDRMMQLTYASKTEPPLTMYILAAGGTGDAPATVQSFGSNRSVSWVSDHVRFLLTADKTEQDMKMLAVIVQSQMPRHG